MKVISAIALLALAGLPAQATVTFNIDALNLRTSGGAYMPLGGQIFLVASTTDSTFGGPSPSSFVTGDDVILSRWTLSGTGTGGDLDPGVGFFQGSVAGIDLTGGLTSGDAVGLYWYPTLTSESTSPGQGTTYGFYHSDTGADGSESWTVPSDGDTRTLLFLTADYGGSNPESAGNASLTVVPEASNLITAGLALGLVAFRLVPQVRRKLKA